ncbi:hypothetical protein LAZ67_13000660 [Cordylochernes scorpioides]|uniref:Transposase n=1 Tax=Cordylochernes scorpioides TaxID=51811 RepID=A0ABY6L3Z1_9ARAC|nr:hypothetical protein LAZ67_13000660 [Cordylochernes scorpioides]
MGKNFKSIDHVRCGPPPRFPRMCGTSLKTINNIIHKDLELDTRRKGKVHKLTPFHMKNRATNARKLYEEHLAGSRSEYTATLDEAWMYVTYCNGIRKICYIKRGNQVPDNWVHQCSETFPKGFMVVGVMTGRGVLPLIKVPSKVKGKWTKCSVHHDKASSHTSNKTQQFLQEMKDTLGLNFIRNSDIPVKSPNASPLDFYGFDWKIAGGHDQAKKPTNLLARGNGEVSDKSTQQIITDSRQDYHNEGDHNEEGKDCPDRKEPRSKMEEQTNPSNDTAEQTIPKQETTLEEEETSPPQDTSADPLTQIADALTQSFFDNFDVQADRTELTYTDRLRKLPCYLQENYYQNKTVMGMKLDLPADILIESLTDGLPVADQRLVATVQPNTIKEWFDLVSSGPQSTFDFKSSQTTYCRYNNSTYRMALPPLSIILILFFNIFSTNNLTIVTKHCNLIQDHR